LRIFRLRTSTTFSRRVHPRCFDFRLPFSRARDKPRHHGAIGILSTSRPPRKRGIRPRRAASRRAGPARELCNLFRTSRFIELLFPNRILSQVASLVSSIVTCLPLSADCRQLVTSIYAECEEPDRVIAFAPLMQWLTARSRQLHKSAADFGLRTTTARSGAMPDHRFDLKQHVIHRRPPRLARPGSVRVSWVLNLMLADCRRGRRARSPDMPLGLCRTPAMCRIVRPR